MRLLLERFRLAPLGAYESVAGADAAPNELRIDVPMAARFAGLSAPQAATSKGQADAHHQLMQTRITS